MSSLVKSNFGLNIDITITVIIVSKIFLKAQIETLLGQRFFNHMEPSIYIYIYGI